jgi:hypothetical protein
MFNFSFNKDYGLKIENCGVFYRISSNDMRNDGKSIGLKEFCRLLDEIDPYYIMFYTVHIIGSSDSRVYDEQDYWDLGALKKELLSNDKLEGIYSFEIVFRI